MKADENNLVEFTLFGGPLYRLGQRLRLVGHEGGTFGFGVSLGLLMWIVLVLVAVAVGYADRVFSLSAVGVHVRLLVVVPLFFLCETWVFPRMTEFARDIVATGVVPESEKGAFAEVVRSVVRLKESGWAELVLGLTVLVVPLFEARLGLTGRTGNLSAHLAVTGGYLGGILLWYFGFCLPLFRFLLLRWLWHLVLWCLFLWRIQQLKLHLVPTHSDQTAGLGYLEIVHEHFSTLVFALSAICAGSFAEDLSTGAVTFEKLYYMIPLVLLLVAALFLGPLLIFSGKLWVCRIEGWRAYTAMASRYVDGFHKKWIDGDNPSSEPLLGTPDMQSLADLTGSVDVVRGMRWVPVSKRLLLSLSAAAVLPMLPLALFKYPIRDLAQLLFQTLSGL